MSLSIGIIGLPNVGKSTVFNALTGTQNAAVANYPFCTIQPNRATVPLKDERLEKIQSLIGVENIIYSTIEFVDIAGLVKGASQGEGLGNQFLSHVRNSDVLIHVVRGFDDPNVVHVSGEVDPKNDVDIINIELALADVAQLDRKITRLESDLKGDIKLQPKLHLAKSIREHLLQGYPVVSHPESSSDLFEEFILEMRFLTAKPVIYVLNVDETGLAHETEGASVVRSLSNQKNSQFLILCAKLEEELVDMSQEEQKEFLELAGAESSGLEQIIRKGFNALGLISFFTKNNQEVRAWNISKGTNAQKAAGKIHTDFEKGFIRAEVVPYETFIKYGSDSAVRSAGQMRSEGKDYVVNDGDIILFRFNV